MASATNNNVIQIRGECAVMVNQLVAHLRKYCDPSLRRWTAIECQTNPIPNNIAMVIFMSAGPSQPRPAPLREIYSKLEDLKQQTGGPFYLKDCDGQMNWPDKGIYIFFAHDSDVELAPVKENSVGRIGTVGVSTGSSNNLWPRLRQHRGNQRGKFEQGGNHRGSVFRLHVGRALIERDGLHEDYPLWGKKHADWPDDVETADVRAQEHPLEKRVSDYIGSLPFLVLNVPGEAGPKSDRASIEQRLISTFSFYRRTQDWLKSDQSLTLHSPKTEIYRTGLWNINHVDGFASSDVVYDVKEYIPKTDPPIPETDEEEPEPDK